MIKIHDFAKDRTMNAQICFSRCSGTLPAVSSKSVMHRLLLAAALGDTPVCIRYYGDSDDISATMGCVSALGGRIEEEKTPGDRKSTRLNSSHRCTSRMPSSA